MLIYLNLWFIHAYFKHIFHGLGNNYFFDRWNKAKHLFSSSNMAVGAEVNKAAAFTSPGNCCHVTTKKLWIMQLDWVAYFIYVKQRF